MIAHPSTGHLPRTYSHNIHTASRRNINKENPAAGGNGLSLPSKTPSRAWAGGGQVKMGLGPGTAMRVGLGPKTEGRDRNVLLPQTEAGKGKGKGKGKEGMDIEPKRLFASTSKPKLQASKSIAFPTILGKQPTKTPARPPPSRGTSNLKLLRTPAPSIQPFAEPAPTPLPSAARTRRRSRQSLPQSVTPVRSGDAFHTPASKWEEEHSLESITEGFEEIQLGVTGSAMAEVGEEGSDGEVEYMPPPVQGLPWEPAWPHPELKPIFDTLSSLPPLWQPADDTAPHLPSPELVVESDMTVIKLKYDEFEEPILRRASKPKPVTTAVPSRSSSLAVKRPGIAVDSRTILTATGMRPAPGSRAAPAPLRSTNVPAPRTVSRARLPAGRAATTSIRPTQRANIGAPVKTSSVATKDKPIIERIPELDLAGSLGGEDISFELRFHDMEAETV